ncbi:unannotated protein [freshwater metagenome]|uniref:Unannotated protein n=1 Tax=freshwater metagenome TaxID=449393 RepID=A0A6J7EYW9_9ZZZZ|nr:hypothetical protein [Actinomycetota bacterium]
MKKLLLIALLFLNFSTFPSFADDEITEIIATAESADVLVDLPDDLEPGYHIVTVDVVDPDTGESTQEDISFCKDNESEIHWDNICPDLDIIVDPATLENIESVEDLPAYNPAKEAEKTSQTQVAGFTALSVLSAGGAAVGAAVGGAAGGASSGGGGSSGGSGGGSGSGTSRGAARREDSEGNGESEARVVDAEDAFHSAHSKDSSRFEMTSDELEMMGLGDRSFTWRAPLTHVTDALVLTSSLKVARFSPLFSKFISDANYLRAIFGSLSFLSVPIGIALGIFALQSSNFQPMPPTWTLLVALSILSIFEAVGGLTAVLVFSVGVFASGNASNLNSVLTVLAISAICVSPSILAGSFRPFRRKLTGDESIWERGSDYLLAAILTNWTFVGFINSLNVIAGKQLAITGQAKEIGFAVGIAVIARMMLEDLAIYLYPVRTARLQLSPPKPSLRQQYISNALKALVFAVVMERFIGFSVPLLLGTALFVLPNLLKLSAGTILPKSRLLHFALPKGGVRIVVMTILGTLFAKLAAEIFTNPQDFLTWGFLLLSIPGFVVSILGLLSDDKNAGSLRHHKVGNWIYRIGGIGILYLIVQIAAGKDVVALLTGGA